MSNRLYLLHVIVQYGSHSVWIQLIYAVWVTLCKGVQYNPYDMPKMADNEPKTTTICLIKYVYLKNTFSSHDKILSSVSYSYLSQL